MKANNLNLRQNMINRFVGTHEPPHRTPVVPGPEVVES
jgi:hypothetical protein